jgi:hypothetical protein
LFVKAGDQVRSARAGPAKIQTVNRLASNVKTRPHRDGYMPLHDNCEWLMSPALPHRTRPAKTLQQITIPH